MTCGDYLAKRCNGDMLNGFAMSAVEVSYRSICGPDSYEIARLAAADDGVRRIAELNCVDVAQPWIPLV